jgi:FkbM family methyltransferase
MEITKYGTEYGGWFLPKEIFLNEDSVIYSAGAGEDISFDIILSSRFNSNIILIDPTKRAYDHYIECYNFYKSNKAFSQRIKTDYSKILLSEKPNFSKITFLKVGLWHESGQLKFYKQNNPHNVSQTLIESMFGNEFEIVPVQNLKSIMNANKHSCIDLLKIDIEGAEVNVLNNILEENIFPKYICVEFDLLIKKIDKTETLKLIQRMKSYGYNLIHPEADNALFIKT